MRVILRVETSPDDHPAEVPEAVLPANDEERLVEVRVVFSQLLLLDLSNSSKKQPPVNVYGATTKQRLNCNFYVEEECEHRFISACSFFSWIILISLSSLCALRYRTVLECWREKGQEV